LDDGHLDTNLLDHLLDHLLWHLHLYLHHLVDDHLLDVRHGNVHLVHNFANHLL